MAVYLNGSQPNRSYYGFEPEDLFGDRPWKPLSTRFPLEPIEKKSNVGKNDFQVSLDVQHFRQNDISVKIENNSVVINAKHKEKRDDQGLISREYTRRYLLPDGFKGEDVTSLISTDGVLTIKAIKGNVRQVPIQRTGPARLNVPENEEEKKTGSGDTQKNGQ